MNQPQNLHQHGRLSVNEMKRAYIYGEIKIILLSSQWISIYNCITVRKRKIEQISEQKSQFFFNLNFFIIDLNAVGFNGVDHRPNIINILYMLREIFCNLHWFINTGLPSKYQINRAYLPPDEF